MGFTWRPLSIAVLSFDFRLIFTHSTRMFDFLRSSLWKRRSSLQKSLCYYTLLLYQSDSDMMINRRVHPSLDKAVDIEDQRSKHSVIVNITINVECKVNCFDNQTKPSFFFLSRKSFPPCSEVKLFPLPCKQWLGCCECVCVDSIKYVWNCGCVPNELRIFFELQSKHQNCFSKFHAFSIRVVMHTTA